MKRLARLVKEASKSDVIVAVLLFLALDLALRFAFASAQHQPPKLGFDVPFRSRAWWAVRDFVSQDQAPDLVLFGASDMTCALYGAEATFLKKPQSELLKHHSEYLERRLADMESPYKRTFCLGIPGEMPSDAYFLTKTLLTGPHKPRAICFSVSPRDFCDATFGDPASTDIYKLMSKLGGTSGFDFSCRRSWLDRFDYLLGRIISTYGHKWELMSLQHHIACDVLGPLLSQDYTTIRAPVNVRQLALLELPEDYAPPELVDLPFDPKNPSFKDNSAEWHARYRKFKKRTFTEQMGFFRKLGELCKERGIRFIVANTPLTGENLAILPPSIYNLYLTEASRVVRENGGTFVDLVEANLFTHDDFFDTAHLNGRGGMRFLDQIALVTSKSPQVAAAAAAQPH